MADAAPAAPSLDAIQAALRKTTEALAYEVANPTTSRPDWSRTEWLVARGVAAMHGVSPLLARQLRWQGPPGWERFLAEQRAHTELRHRRIEALLARIDTEARAAGVALLALKGPALHALELYGPGDRPMADLDLLAREDDVSRAARLLEELGFHETYATYKHRVFEPDEPRAAAAFGEHSSNGIPIELHVGLKEALAARIDVTALILPRELRPGLNPYPSNAALLSHLLVHAAGAIPLQCLRLLNLLDISRVSARMSEADWEVFSASIRRDRLWWAYPPLVLAARYGFAVPGPVVEAAESVCPLVLRRVSRRRTLTDVSLSRLFIPAFPGLPWARSVREAIAYVKERTLPSAYTAGRREHAARTHPSLTRSQWAHLSQGRRILRWLFTRPAAPHTLFVVRQALAQPDD